MTMGSQNAEALVELTRLCSEVRAGLSDSGFHRLCVLLDMILVDLAREGFAAESAAQQALPHETESPLP